MWKLTIEDDEGKKTPLSLARNEYTIGRSEENTVRLTERNVSRKHALVRREGTGWTFIDLNSANGSLVNAMRFQGERPVAANDVFQVGDYRLTFENEETVQPAAASAVANPMTHDRLVVVVGPEPGQEFPLTVERVVLGRAEDAQVVLQHGSVSRVHAEIHALGGGRYEVVDQGSFNGVRVNGSQLQRGLLEAGDYIELGDVRLRFVGAGQYYQVGAEGEKLEEGDYDPHGPSGRPAVAVPPETSDDDEDTPTFRRSGVGIWIGAGALAVLLGAGLVALAFRSSGRSSANNPVAAVQSSPAPDSPLGALTAAMKLAASGNIEGAHARLSTIPQESSVRDLSDFKTIEASWADALLARAGKDGDIGLRRDWLKAVAQSTSVDAERRKRAGDAILALDEGVGTDIRELPAEKKGAKDKAAAGATGAAGAVAAQAAPPPTPAATPGHPVLAANPFDEAPAAAPAPVAREPKTAAAAAPAAKATDLALSGRDGEAKARAELEPRVFGGKATVDEIKMLRAICRHQGDRACTDRVTALLDQGK